MFSWPMAWRLESRGIFSVATRHWNRIFPWSRAVLSPSMTDSTLMMIFSVLYTKYEGIH